MPNLAFTNLDSIWLSWLADEVRAGTSTIGGDKDANKAEARLRQIAENLQRLDEANAALSNNRSYDEGYAAAMSLMRKRSNVLSSHGISEADGKSIMDALTEHVPVTKVPMGKRALDDTPKFNGGFVRKQAKPKPQPKVDLDLSFLESL